MPKACTQPIILQLNIYYNVAFQKQHAFLKDASKIQYTKGHNLAASGPYPKFSLGLLYA